MIGLLIGIALLQLVLCAAVLRKISRAVAAIKSGMGYDVQTITSTIAGADLEAAQRHKALSADLSKAIARLPTTRGRKAAASKDQES